MHCKYKGNIYESVALRAVKIVIAHNHPSLDIQPSKEDNRVE